MHCLLCKTILIAIIRLFLFGSLKNLCMQILDRFKKYPLLIPCFEKQVDYFV